MTEEDKLVSYFYLINGAAVFFLLLTLTNKLKQNIILNFLELNILWFIAFFYAPFYWIVNRAFFKISFFDPDFYFLGFLYTTILLFCASTLICLGKKHEASQIKKTNLLKIKFIPVVFLGVSVVLNFWLKTPLAEFILTGSSTDARFLQEDWHSSKGNDSTFGKLVCAGLAWVPLVYFVNEKKFISKILLFLSSCALSAFYFSKTGFLIPFIVLILFYLSQTKRVSYYIISFLSVIVLFFASFCLSNLDNISKEDFVQKKFVERIIAETGWAPLHFEILKQSNPPHFYASRYFFGFKTLFGIEKKVDYSREAYFQERGSDSATTSGFAGVPLYAFFGKYWFLVFPLIISFIYFIDLKLRKTVLKTSGGLIFYFYICCTSINALTVDPFRVFSPVYLIVPNLIFTGICGLLILKIIEKNKIISVTNLKSG